GLSRFEEIFEALIGLGRCAEAGILPHRPHLAEIHRRIDSARERILARFPQFRIGFLRAVQRRDRRARAGLVLRQLLVAPVLHYRRPAFLATAIFFHSTRNVAASTISSL